MTLDEATVVRRRPSAPLSTGTIWRACRPLQWLKNVLVFAAPAAAGVLDTRRAWEQTVVIFVAFCLVASGLYLWNDIGDRHADRRHPVKRHRPIASGQLAVVPAAALATALLAAGLGLALVALRWQAAAILGVYAATTIAYTFWLKHVAVVDLLVVASGFVLRAAGGAVATDVEMSKWFVLCTTFGSLFIVTGKRYAELRDIGEGASDVRSTLGAYTPEFLRSVLTLSCTAAVLAYCQWAFETMEQSTSDLPLFELSIIPMVAGLLRYLLVVENGDGAAPEHVFVRDRVLQLLGAIWALLVALGVYLQ